jgi:F-type H+-transporting ATPase subunit b
MDLDWWTLALQTVNFAVLVWLLHRFLYRPVLRLIEARKAEVQQQLAQVKGIEEKAKAHLADLEAQRVNIMGERESALKSAAVRAEESAQARRAQVEREAKAILEQAHKAAEAEREGMLAEGKRIALDLGADYARRLTSEVPSALRAEAWIEKIEQHLQALPKSELEPLANQVGNGGMLTVVTAIPLPEATIEAWRKRLQLRLGNGARMEFEVDPDLVAGAELHFPTAVLSFSWQSTLATLRSQMDVHGDAH